MAKPYTKSQLQDSPSFKIRTFERNPAALSLTEDAGTFSVVSYNILAECHRLRTDYSYTNEEFLSQEYRHGLLMKELLYLNGDVVCLQEVNPEYFQSTLLPAMKKHGYDGLMKRRTMEYYDEGEATFFKTDVFHLDTSVALSLTDSAISELETLQLCQERKTAAAEYLNCADIILVTQLRCKETDKVVTIGNVHIWWEADLHPDIKCVQAACAMKEVLKISGSEGAHVLCGDFNSDRGSPVYQLMEDGALSPSSLRTLQAVQALKLADGSSRALVDHFEAAMQHPSTGLKSAYSAVLGQEPEITCYTDRAWLLDYIFYDSKTLLPVGVLGPVDSDVVTATGGLPSRDFPSDHTSLKAVFAFV